MKIFKAMNQFPHDDFIKEYLPELFKDYGIGKGGENVKGETREIDVFFIPQKPVPTTPETLGLLGKLAQKTCLFEVFRNPVNPEEIKSCLGKLFDIAIAIAIATSSAVRLTPNRNRHYSKHFPSHHVNNQN